MYFNQRVRISTFSSISFLQHLRNMSSTDPRPSTPPHHPNFGIQMSTEIIRKLVHLALPEVELIHIESLPSLKSYNNRIYFLKCSRPTTDGSDLENEEFVLKINGRDFKSDKIENEVSCLRLIETFCPGITVPRAIAWSQDGSKMAVARSDGRGMEVQAFDGNTGGWILMTRVPGEPTDLSQHDNEILADLAVQLADHVTDWRHNIPSQMHGGSLRFQNDESKDSRPDITLTDSKDIGSNLVIRGILGEVICCLDPITTVADYYKVLIEHKLRTLETNETFEPNRSLVAPVRKFMQEVLPTMSSLNTEPMGSSLPIMISPLGMFLYQAHLLKSLALSTLSSLDSFLLSTSSSMTILRTATIGRRGCTKCI